MNKNYINENITHQDVFNLINDFNDKIYSQNTIHSDFSYNLIHVTFAGEQVVSEKQLIDINNIEELKEIIKNWLINYAKTLLNIATL